MYSMTRSEVDNDLGFQYRVGHDVKIYKKLVYRVLSALMWSKPFQLVHHVCNNATWFVYNPA